MASTGSWYSRPWYKRSRGSGMEHSSRAAQAAQDSAPLLSLDSREPPCSEHHEQDPHPHEHRNIQHDTEMRPPDQQTAHAVDPLREWIESRERPQDSGQPLERIGRP